VTAVAADHVTVLKAVRAACTEFHGPCRFQSLVLAGQTAFHACGRSAVTRRGATPGRTRQPARARDRAGLRSACVAHSPVTGPQGWRQAALAGSRAALSRLRWRLAR
jgi:hypothetical protein